MMGKSGRLPCGPREVQSPFELRGGAAELISSHGRGIGSQDALKGEFRGLSGFVAGNPGFP